MDSNADSTVRARQLKRAISLSALASLSYLPLSPALAGGSVAALITRMVTIPYHDVVIVHTATPVISPPTCPPGNVSDSYIFSVRTPGGRALLNQLLHAQALGYPVQLQGTGVCKFWNLTREELEFAVVLY